MSNSQVTTHCTVKEHVSHDICLGCERVLNAAPGLFVMTMPIGLLPLGFFTSSGTHYSTSLLASRGVTIRSTVSVLYADTTTCTCLWIQLIASGKIKISPRVSPTDNGTRIFHHTMKND